MARHVTHVGNSDRQLCYKCLWNQHFTDTSIDGRHFSHFVLRRVGCASRSAISAEVLPNLSLQSLSMRADIRVMVFRGVLDC